MPAKENAGTAGTVHGADASKTGRSKRSKNAADAIAESVYAGRDYLGSVVSETRCQWAAADASGHVLGIYPSVAQARHAVWLARGSGAA